ncbi:MAG: hypothetical protein Q3M30_16370 [Candidatus Electrothrix sp. Rat3]|nr:hypothetical protein [Candidatus Electrothrix rattekaaiensis]
MIKKSQSESCRVALADTGTVQNDYPQIKAEQCIIGYGTAHARLL